MIPLVSANREVELVKAPHRRDRRRGAGASRASRSTYKLGVMVETPRAALRAGDLAASSAFLSLRHQRPDPDDLWPQPRRRRPLHARLRQPRRLSPRIRSTRLDLEGVGELMLIAARRGRARNPDAGARPLRRARRRPVLGALLQGRGLRLRLLLAVPRADRAARGGAGDAARPRRRRRGGRRPRNEAAARRSAGARRRRQGGARARCLSALETAPEDPALVALLDAAWAAPQRPRARPDRAAGRGQVDPDQRARRRASRRGGETVA